MNESDIRQIAGKCFKALHRFSASSKRYDYEIHCIEQAILEATQQLQQRIEQLEKENKELRILLSNDGALTRWRLLQRGVHVQSPQALLGTKSRAAMSNTTKEEGK